MPRPDRFDTPTPLDEDPDDVPASLRGLGFRPFGAGISQNNLNISNMDWEEFSGAVDAQAGQALRDRRRMARKGIPHPAFGFSVLEAGCRRTAQAMA